MLLLFRDRPGNYLTAVVSYYGASSARHFPRPDVTSDDADECISYFLVSSSRLIRFFALFVRETHLLCDRSVKICYSIKAVHFCLATVAQALSIRAAIGEWSAFGWRVRRSGAGGEQACDYKADGRKIHSISRESWCVLVQLDPGLGESWQTGNAIPGDAKGFHVFA